jgi:hypothetical protein
MLSHHPAAGRPLEVQPDPAFRIASLHPTVAITCRDLPATQVTVKIRQPLGFGAIDAHRRPSQCRTHRRHCGSSSPHRLSTIWASTVSDSGPWTPRYSFETELSYARRTASTEVGPYRARSHPMMTRPAELGAWTTPSGSTLARAVKPRPAWVGGARDERTPSRRRPADAAESKQPGVAEPPTPGVP